MQIPVTHFAEATVSAQLPKVNSPCLLVEGDIPIRFDIELVLRKRFNAAIRRLFIPTHQRFSLPAHWWEDYDLILLSGVDMNAVDWGVENIPTDKQPPVFALTKGERFVLPHPTIDRVLPAHTSASAFARELDELLEIRNLLKHYPWLRHKQDIGCPLELLHRSEGAVLFRTLCPNGFQVVKYFKIETQLLAQHHFTTFLELVVKLQTLNHPGVVPISEVHASTHGIYIVMDYVEGDTLKNWLRDEPLPPLARRLAWFKGLVEAVGILHQSGIVHGDLKSSNIMVRLDDQPVLLDFGLDGQLLREAGALSEGEIYGTPYYVSPELIMGDPLEAPADLYALGVLFYELMTGNKPYQGGSLDLILRKHMLAPIPPLPDELQHYQPLLQRMMAKIPESRIQSANAILEQLHELTLQPA